MLAPFYFYTALSYNFLAFLPCFSFNSAFSPCISRYVSPLRIASSVQQSSICSSSANTCQILVFFASFAFCLSSEFLSFYLFYIFAVLFFISWRVCCALVPGTLAFDLPAFINPRFSSFFFCPTVCHHRNSLGRIIRMDTGCTTDVG